MEFTHPVQRLAANFPGNWEMAERQATEWDAALLAMEALQPGDPNAEAVLRNAAALRQSLAINYPCGEWAIVQAYRIWNHAERIFGAGQLKFNKPVESLGTGGGDLRSSRSYAGMRLKYQHNGGL